MVKVGKCASIALMHKKWTLRVELTKKTSHRKSRDFLRVFKRKYVPHDQKIVKVTISKVEDANNG